MKKFVYLLYGKAYEDCIISAIREVPEAYSFKPFSNRIVEKIQILHNSRLLNEKRELPLKGIWFKRALKEMDIEKDDEIYFILYESFHLSYSGNFLKYLKEKFPSCKLCFMYLNPVTELIAGKVKKVSHILDAVITFNEKDSKEYGLVFIPFQPYKLPIYKDDNIPESDVFFIGADKGRLSKLLSIYEKLTASGLKCDFHIVNVKEEDKKYSNDIIYNKTMTYSEVLARVNATKCVLEVLQNDEDYVSIRTAEALQYHRKLLTESESVKKYDFYNPKTIQVFDDISKINTDFIRETIKDSEFDKGYPGEASYFHELLVERI